MRKFIIKWLIYTIISILLIPIIITFIYNGKAKIYPYEDDANMMEKIPIEEYIKGVVAAEVPASFEMEALKAQAVAARTFALYHGFSEYASPEALYQEYLTDDELKEVWGDNFEKNNEIITSAVRETKGEVLTYKDEPILAVFHSASAGKTEASEYVWQEPLPYLVSVQSSFDEDAPVFESTRVLKEEEVRKALITERPGIMFTLEPLSKQMEVTELTPAGYVKTFKAGSELFNGQEIRDIFNLNSASFTVTQNGEYIIFKTKGYGHGAGMSQYGANYMAKAGYTYDEILKHYYQGADITR